MHAKARAARSAPDVLLRQLAMLRLLPRAPRQIGTAELRARLAELGFATTFRTIQRDLQTLATAFAIECHNGSKPYGWRWRSDAPLIELPPMNEEAAHALLTAVRSLPPEQARSLESHLAHARQALDRSVTWS
jgi:predicted DNA-binding transcriptional regulator YafY